MVRVKTHTVGWRGRAAVLAVVLCAAGAVAVVLLATAAGGSSGGYTVRAIFDDAGNVISGEEVKIDGVRVGTVGSVTPTPQQKAAVVLKIENPGFQDFRSDASCTIRPQALIGEKYVDCLPTQPHAEGVPLPPPLKQIPSGQEGAGEYLLPVENNHSPVDVDLLGDITRLPERQRLTLIINELGAGLAGRGPELNEVIRRADPALGELDKVLKILAEEDRTLASLATDSSRVLQPLAAVRKEVGDFIAKSAAVSRATAAHDTALAANLADFPAFLKQLGPAMERLGRLAEQTAPAFESLKVAAPGLNEAFTKLAPFANSSRAFFTTLGQTAKGTGPALASLKPLLERVRSLGAAAKPFSGSASELLTSLRQTGGLERLLDLIFLGAGTTNGYDALGHFLRAEGVANLCVSYQIARNGKCEGRLFNSAGLGGSAASQTGTTASATSSASAGAGSTATTGSGAAAGAVKSSEVLARTLAELSGSTPEQAVEKYPGSAPSAQELSGSSSLATALATPHSAAVEGAAGMLLKYLLGE
jgi:virulence factor Mce-like protein